MLLKGNNVKIVLKIIFLLAQLIPLAIVPLSTAIIPLMAGGTTVIVPSTKYPTIQSAALDPKVSKIIVMPGIYTESVQILTTKIGGKSLEIVSSDNDPSKTKITATPIVFAVRGPNVKISGFTIEGPYGIRVFNGDSAAPTDNVTIEGNIITSVTEGVSIAEGNKIIVNNNLFLDCGTGISVYGSGGSPENWPSKFNVTNNIISSSSQDGILLASCFEGRIENNTITRSGGNGIKIEWAKHASVTKNKVLFNKIGIYDSGGRARITWNDIVNNTQNTKAGRPDNVWPAYWDYNLYSDYTGTDQNGDGIGETPYVLGGLQAPPIFSDNHPRTSKTGSPSSGINLAIIPLSLSNQPNTLTKAQIEALGAELVDYYKEVSYGKLVVNVKVVDNSGSWFTVPKSVASYNAVNGKEQFMVDAISAVDDAVDFTTYDFEDINGKGTVAFITMTDLFGKGAFASSNKAAPTRRKMVSWWMQYTCSSRGSSLSQE